MGVAAAAHRRAAQGEQEALAGLAALAMADSSGRWVDLDRLLLRPGNLVGPGFEPGPEVLIPSHSIHSRVLGSGSLLNFSFWSLFCTPLMINFWCKRTGCVGVPRGLMSWELGISVCP